MFEQIKAWKHLRHSRKAILGMKRLGEIINDEALIKQANEALDSIERNMKQIVKSRKMAKKYNLECVKNGF